MRRNGGARSDITRRRGGLTQPPQGLLRNGVERVTADRQQIPTACLVEQAGCLARAAELGQVRCLVFLAGLADPDDQFVHVVEEPGTRQVTLRGGLVAREQERFAELGEGYAVVGFFAQGIL